ncbi:MAG: hypothetical protein IPM54_02465 [Polyangiaceae bacterium]|nr:hypothetical protein [Polyangiaceae bacterium]
MSRNGKLATLLLVVALLGLGAGALLITFTPLGITARQNPGFFHRKHFEAVVARVRSMAPAPGQEARFRLDDPSEPTSLRFVAPAEEFARGAGSGTVWAAVTPDGKLKVVIETRDLGHAGEYGFAYSDVPLSPQPFGGAWSTIDVPGHINLVKPDMNIDEHWWKVLYNLD